MWQYRERVNYYEKVRRSLYEVLRDTLQTRLMKLSLVDSFYNFVNAGEEYIFLEKSELKPKSKKMEKESDLYNTFIVIFCEGLISSELKNYLRFFPENKLVKKNVEYLADLTIYKKFHQNLKYFESPRFFDVLEDLLNVDYALLIQSDPAVKKKNRYALTHFHVKVDWPIADAAEDLAKELRYIQSNLYEKGDKTAWVLQRKLFEFYACHHNVGGRRTAGLIAAQLLRRLDCISTVFVSSSESRSMVKYSERGVSKFFLIKLNRRQTEALADQEQMDVKAFRDVYLYPAKSYYIGVSEALYEYTDHSKPPEEGKQRKLRPAYNWLKLGDEFLHPKETSLEYRPVNYDWVYAA